MARRMFDSATGIHVLCSDGEEGLDPALHLGASLVDPARCYRTRRAFRALRHRGSLYRVAVITAAA